MRRAPSLRLPGPAQVPEPPAPLPDEGALVLSIERAAAELGFRPTALDDWLALTLARRV